MNEQSLMETGLHHGDLNGNSNADAEKFSETSSVENKVKPKKGVFKKFNTVISRIFTSKL